MLTMTVLQAPTIFEKPYMVMVPNKNKGKEAVAPYLFDSKAEAEEFLHNLTKKLTYWWSKED